MSAAAPTRFLRAARRRGIRRGVARTLMPAACELFRETPEQVLADREAFEIAAARAILGDAGNLELSYEMVDTLASAVEVLGLARVSDVPDPFRRVWIENVAGERKQGVVLRLAGGEISIFCPPDRADFWRAGAIMTVSYRGFDSSVRVDLRLTDAVRLPHALVLHLTRPGAGGAIGRDDRRVECRLEGALRALGEAARPEQAEWQPIEVRDTSFGGLRVLGGVVLEPDQTVELEVALPDAPERPLRVEAVVCWRRPGELGQPEHGLRIANFPARGAERWGLFVARGIAEVGEAPPPEEGVPDGAPDVEQVPLEECADPEPERDVSDARMDTGPPAEVPAPEPSVPPIAAEFAPVAAENVPAPVALFEPEAAARGEVSAAAAEPAPDSGQSAWEDFESALGLASDPEPEPEPERAPEGSAEADRGSAELRAARDAAIRGLETVSAELERTQSELSAVLQASGQASAERAASRQASAELEAQLERATAECEATARRTAEVERELLEARDALELERTSAARATDEAQRAGAERIAAESAAEAAAARALELEAALEAERSARADDVQRLQAEVQSQGRLRSKLLDGLGEARTELTRIREELVVRTAQRQAEREARLADRAEFDAARERLRLKIEELTADREQDASVAAQRIAGLERELDDLRIELLHRTRWQRKLSGLMERFTDPGGAA